MPITKAALYRNAGHAGYQARAAVAERLKAPRLQWDAISPWTCTECGEAVAFQDSHLAPGEWDPCRCQREAYEAARQAYIKEHWAEAVEGQWGSYLIPPRFLRAGFLTFNKRPGTETAVPVCKAYAEQFEVGVTCHGLILIGDVGGGKTHLAVAVARRITERTLAEVYFTTAMGLLAEIKASFGKEDPSPPRGFRAMNVILRRGRGEEPEANPRELAKQAELLVLDDLGQERGTEFDREVLFDVINFRYEQCLPTIITSNQGDATLRDRLGPAAVSRLYEMCRMVRLEASDYRGEMAAG